MQVGIVRELVARCRELTLRANQLQAELARRVARVCPRLLGLPGCGVLTAAKIVAEVAGVGRFRTEAGLGHAGKSNREALRVLKRRLARLVFNLLHADLDQSQLGPSATPVPTPQPAA